ncbi:MFS transporter [Effusibacillus consociatus]|uniref:MFS transporter n=1 Tax=Effusibacillus consociatus TaxID=1117041 RepID=A0ABV9PZJ1_9BACL
MGLSLWSNRAFVFWIIGTAISFLGQGIYFITVTWALFQLTGSALPVGIMLGLTAIPGILTAVPAGVIADRYDRRIITVLMDVWRALVVMLLPISIWFNFHSVWTYYVVTIGITLGSNFFYPAQNGLIKEIIPTEHLLKANSTKAISQQLGMIAGTGLAGFLISFTSTEIVTVISSFTFLISGVFLYGMRKGVHHPQRKISKRSSMWNEYKEGFRYLTKNRLLLILLILGMFVQFCVQIINTLLAPYATSVLHVDVKGYGMIDAAFAIGSVLAGITIPFIKKIFSQKVYPWTVVLVSTAILAIGLSWNLYTAIFSYLWTGVIFTVESSLRQTMSITITDSEFIGRVGSLNWLMYSTIVPIVGISGGWLSEFIEIQKIYIGITAVMVVVSLLSFQIRKDKSSEIFENKKQASPA